MRLIPILAAVTAAIVSPGLLWPRSSSTPQARSEWVQVTNFPDSVAQPTPAESLPGSRSVIYDFV